MTPVYPQADKGAVLLRPEERRTLQGLEVHCELLALVSRIQVGKHFALRLLLLLGFLLGLPLEVLARLFLLARRGLVPAVQELGGLLHHFLRGSRRFPFLLAEVG